MLAEKPAEPVSVGKKVQFFSFSSFKMILGYVSKNLQGKNEKLKAKLKAKKRKLTEVRKKNKNFREKIIYGEVFCLSINFFCCNAFLKKKPLSILLKL